MRDEFNHDFFTCNKVTEEKTFSATLKTKKCVDGRTSPSTQQSTAGRDGREGRRCLSAGHPLTTPGGQPWVHFFFTLFLRIFFWGGGAAFVSYQTPYRYRYRFFVIYLFIYRILNSCSSQMFLYKWRLYFYVVQPFIQTSRQIFI